MEFEQGTNYANVLPNDALSEVLGRAMQKAGGYELGAALLRLRLRHNLSSR
jgi:hypothetical protein